MKLLTDVDADEVSPVLRAANRRRFVLKADKGKTMDNEIDDIISVPWAHEGALLDTIRKEGVEDETVEKAVILAVRLLKGVEEEFSPELIEKMGKALYSNGNPDLNTGTGTGGGGELTGADSGGKKDGSASGAAKDGSGRDGELSGTGSGAKVAADGEDEQNTDDSSKEDESDLEKRDFSAGDRKKLADKGKALPDKSFPIENTGDLKNAIKLAGNAKDPGKARAFIRRRAAALGASGMIPDSWGVSKADDETDDAADIEAVNEDVTKTDHEGGTVEVQVPVRKEDGTWDLSGVPEGSREFFTEMVQKADKTEAELKETREALAKSDETLRTREMITKAARLSHVAATDDLAPILKAAAEKLDAETFEKLEGVLSAAEERITKGDLFTEMGKNAVNDGTAKSDAWATAVKKADELVEKADGPLSQDQALARVWESNPALYTQYLSENGMGVSF